MISMIKGVINATQAWLFKGVNDEYVHIHHAAPKLDGAKEIPQSLRERDIPDFGSDQERMLQMAVKNFSDEELQVRWLKSMHRVRFQTDNGWVAEHSKRRTRPVVHASRAVQLTDGLYRREGVIIFDEADNAPSFSQIDHERINQLFDQISKPVPVKAKPGLTLVK